MNIESMRAFLEIASAGSFQEAAERLHITQSAISARIKSLEQRLNRRLYLRKRSGVELTDAGQRLLRHAQNCVESWERAQQEIALPNEFDNVISLGVQINLWNRLVNPWTQWMEKHAPQFATRIVSDYSERLLSLLRDGMLDLAIVYSVRAHHSLIIETFTTENLVLVSTEPRSLNTGWTPGYIFVDWAEDFLSQHHATFPDSPPPRLSVASSTVALHHILLHGGSGYFLERDVKEQIESGELMYVDDAPTFSRRSYLVYTGENDVPPALKQALAGLRAVM
ncbi:MAG: LysR family transcriptional regulator [Pseudomonadota bacterium]